MQGTAINTFMLAPPGSRIEKKERPGAGGLSSAISVLSRSRDETHDAVVLCHLGVEEGSAAVFHLTVIIIRIGDHIDILGQVAHDIRPAAEIDGVVCRGGDNA